MYRTVFILALSCVMLSGCSTSKEEMLPAGDNTMLELWNGADGGGSTSRHSAAARDTLRRPLTGSETQADAQADRSYSRTQESEITQQFPRLPNPDMVMYLYRKRRLSHLQRVVEQYGQWSESAGERSGRPRYVAAYLGRNENVRL
ncbi:TIGR03751 family conjugal transfer lipoprotein [Enterobacter hormaechei]|uniref:TIGR03751 family conjugal transfer lipoprotein n=1 Tax=Enterobacter hormaechei TaxID=158836 RepID=UPI001F0E6B72|nr:TIGR03751 family conjugal transfer lipoprotein [Enterobacter hormaechei]